MNVHTIFQYVKYRRKAMGRHGMHSPFVYELIENCIQKNTATPLLNRILKYLEDWPVIQLPEIEPDQWVAVVNALNLPAGSQQMIVVKEIHSTSIHTASWKELCQQQTIQYSLDLFDFGLLFVSPYFKEKQHFVLKN